MNNAVMKSETTGGRVNERVNEERYWRLLESIRGKRRATRRTRRGEGVVPTKVCMDRAERGIQLDQRDEKGG